MRGGIAGTDDRLPDHDVAYSLSDLMAPPGRNPPAVWHGAGQDVINALTNEYRKAAERALQEGDYRRRPSTASSCGTTARPCSASAGRSAPRCRHPLPDQARRSEERPAPSTPPARSIAPFDSITRSANTSPRATCSAGSTRRTPPSSNTVAAEKLIVSGGIPRRRQADADQGRPHRPRLGILPGRLEPPSPGECARLRLGCPDSARRGECAGGISSTAGWDRRVSRRARPRTRVRLLLQRPGPNGRSRSLSLCATNCGTGAPTASPRSFTARSGRGCRRAASSPTSWPSPASWPPGSSATPSTPSGPRRAPCSSTERPGTANASLKRFRIGVGVVTATCSAPESDALWISKAARSSASALRLRGRPGGRVRLSGRCLVGQPGRADGGRAAGGQVAI